MRLFRITLTAQAVYYLVTAIWPLVHIGSFMAVSGPKTDIWLVKTVAVLLLAISACFITQLIVRGNERPVAVLAMSCSAGLLFIDCYYALNGTISKVYLADGLAQLCLLFTWIIIFPRLRNQNK
jgi:hypothetical protein